MQEKIDKAIEAYNKGNWDEAIDLFTSVLEINPDSPQLYNDIGLCYANKSDYQKAEKNYLKSIELDNKQVKSYVNLADLYYIQKDYEHGIALLTNATYELPEEMVLAHFLARFYMEDSRLDLAVDELEKVLENQPENYDARYDLGRVHFDLGDYELAIEDFENVLQYKNNNEFIYYFLAQAYQGIYDVDKAISNYLKAITVNEKFAPAVKGLATMYMARGDYDDAIEYFQEYCELDIPQEETTHIKDVITNIEKLKNEG